MCHGTQSSMQRRSFARQRWGSTICGSWMKGIASGISWLGSVTCATTQRNDIIIVEVAWRPSCTLSRGAMV